MITVKKILFPTDFSRCADQAFFHALRLAKKYDAELHVLHAIILFDYDLYKPNDFFQEIKDSEMKMNDISNQKITAMLKAHHATKLAVTKIVQRGISPAPVILEYAKEQSIDLIVMGTHGHRGVEYLLLGSAAEEVVRKSPCPIMTIRERAEPEQNQTIKRILVPVDFSKFSKQALIYAKEIASSYDAMLQLLHVVEEKIHPSFYVTGKDSIFDFMPEIITKSKQVMQEMMDETGGPNVPAEFFVTDGVSAREIIDFAQENGTDLIVVATHGLTAVDRFYMGGVAEKVARRASCPVFTVKAFGKSLFKDRNKQ